MTTTRKTASKRKPAAIKAAPIKKATIGKRISATKSEKVRVTGQVMEWQEELVCDIRTHVITGKSNGEFIPTIKGAQIPLAKARRFLTKLLTEVEAACEEHGIE